MTSTLLVADAALVLGIWICAALAATSVPYAATARELSRRSGRTLALIGVGLFLIVARVGLVVALDPASWSFTGEKVVVSLAALLAVAAVTVVASVPRLLAIRIAALAFNGVNAMPPALRHEAAHPLLAWPVQLTAYAVAAAEVVFFLASYPATAGSSLVALTGVALAGGFVWRVLARRHARFGGDVMVLRQHVRPLRSAGARAGLNPSTVDVVTFNGTGSAPTYESGRGTGRGDGPSTVLRHPYTPRAGWLADARGEPGAVMRGTLGG